MLPLVESKSAVKSAIDAMAAKGCTRYDVGSVWGWRTLSPNWRTFWENNLLPLDYGDPQMDKAIIIMTDGANTPDCAGDPLTKAQTEAMFAQQCQAMKDEGRDHLHHHLPAERSEHQHALRDLRLRLGALLQVAERRAAGTCLHHHRQRSEHLEI